MSVSAYPRPHARLRARLRHPQADLLDLRDLPPPRRQAHQDREARRRPGRPAPRVAAAPAALRLDGRRQDLSRRRADRDRPRGVPEGDRDVRRAVRADRAEVARRFSPTRHHILLNELDNVRSRVDVLTHQDGRWHREPLPGLPEFGEASVHAVDPDDSDDYFLNATDFLTPTHAGDRHRRRRSGRDAQAASRVLRRQGPGRLAARGRLEGRHPHSLFPGRPQGPRPRRQESDLALRLRRIRDPDAPVVSARRRRGLAGEGGRLRRRQHPRRRRVRPEVAPGGAQGQPAQGLRGLHRRRRGPDPPQGDLAAAPGHRRDGATAAC